MQTKELKERVDKLFDTSMIHWTDWDKVGYLNYCLGVLKNNVDEINIELMEKEFKIFEDKNKERI